MSTTTDSVSLDEERPGGWAFWIGAALGWVVMAFGVAGALEAARRTHPVELSLYFVGGALAHDLLLAPVVLGVGFVLARLGRGLPRQLAAMAAIVVGTVAVFAYPFVRGFGKRPGNPSALPGDYAAGLATLAVGVVGAAVLWWLVARVRRRREA